MEDVDLVNDYVQSFVNDNIQLKLDSLIKFAR